VDRVPVRGGRGEFVNRWNCHEDLLAACEAMLSRMQSSIYRVGGDEEVYRLWCEVMEQGRAAIAKAQPAPTLEDIARGIGESKMRGRGEQPKA
jgi:hypothetical protein